MATKEPSVPANPAAIPLVAKQEFYSDQLARYRNMRDSCMRATNPAECILSALAVRDFVGSAHKNDISSPRPSEAVVGLDASERYLYIVPVKPKTPGSVEMKYRDGRAYFGLYQTFARLDRLVPPDFAEYFDVLPTPGEVVIENVKGWGIYVDLHKVTKEPIQRLTEEEKAARADKRRQTMQSRQAKKETAATEPEAAE